MEVITMSPTTIWKNAIFFGTRKHDNAKINLSAPSWDCGWYWSFGYLGNDCEHYHLDNYNTPYWLQEKQNRNMYDALKNDYILVPKIYENLWVFCELSLTIYTLKETAEVLGRGGSHMTTNPCKDIIINTDEVTRINNFVLPTLFDKLYTIITE